MAHSGFNPSTDTKNSISGDASAIPSSTPPISAQPPKKSESDEMVEKIEERMKRLTEAVRKIGELFYNFDSINYDITAERVSLSDLANLTAAVKGEVKLISSNRNNAQLISMHQRKDHELVRDDNGKPILHPYFEMFNALAYNLTQRYIYKFLAVNKKDFAAVYFFHSNYESDIRRLQELRDNIASIFSNPELAKAELSIPLRYSVADKGVMIEKILPDEMRKIKLLSWAFYKGELKANGSYQSFINQCRRLFKAEDAALYDKFSALQLKRILEGVERCYNELSEDENGQFQPSQSYLDTIKPLKDAIKRAENDPKRRDRAAMRPMQRRIRGLMPYIFYALVSYAMVFQGGLTYLLSLPKGPLLYKLLNNFATFTLQYSTPTQLVISAVAAAATMYVGTRLYSNVVRPILKGITDSCRSLGRSYTLLLASLIGAYIFVYTGGLAYVAGLTPFNPVSAFFIEGAKRLLNDFSLNAAGALLGVGVASASIFALKVADVVTGGLKKLGFKGTGMLLAGVGGSTYAAKQLIESGNLAKLAALPGTNDVYRGIALLAKEINKLASPAARLAATAGSIFALGVAAGAAALGLYKVAKRLGAKASLFIATATSVGVGIVLGDGLPLIAQWQPPHQLLSIIPSTAKHAHTLYATAPVAATGMTVGGVAAAMVACGIALLIAKKGYEMIAGSSKPTRRRTRRKDHSKDYRGDSSTPGVAPAPNVASADKNFRASTSSSQPRRKVETTPGSSAENGLMGSQATRDRKAASNDAQAPASTADQRADNDNENTGSCCKK